MSAVSVESELLFFLILNWVQNIKPLCDLLELLPYFVGVCVLLLSFADVLEFSF